MYDLAIIGAGISSLVLCFELKKSGYKGSIIILEAGRKPGGRLSSKYSRTKPLLRINHGCPKINLSIEDHFTKNYLKWFLNENLIIEDKLSPNNHFFNDSYFKTYCSYDLVDEIYSKLRLHKDVFFKFGTFISELKKSNDIWVLNDESNNLSHKTKYLVLSSSLLLHKRSLSILNKRIIPMRKAIKANNDTKIDILLSLVNKQRIVKRKNIILHCDYDFSLFNTERYKIIELPNYSMKMNGIERIMITNHIDNSISIVIHTIDKYMYRKYLFNKNNGILLEKNITNYLTNTIKDDYIKYFVKNINYRIMTWRGSQSLRIKVNKKLNYSQINKVGFCGDWFNNNENGSVRSSIVSAVKLSKKILYLEKS